ncbi:unnamed protein product [Notodromas monacha]|uniref:Uncharacterized protein n=1 Tax=Notodromas monacha TaxID=399045 RepID=A0A7R9BFA5_9CRUS|nr:unnamed protein product [Notodromas monacha]CAG0914337.1 unnamed protein product [Notodromas monacha]
MLGSHVDASKTKSSRALRRASVLPAASSLVWHPSGNPTRLHSKSSSKVNHFLIKCPAALLFGEVPVVAESLLGASKELPTAAFQQFGFTTYNNRAVFYFTGFVGRALCAPHLVYIVRSPEVVGIPLETRLRCGVEMKVNETLLCLCRVAVYLRLVNVYDVKFASCFSEDSCRALCHAMRLRCIQKEPIKGFFCWTPRRSRKSDKRMHPNKNGVEGASKAGYSPSVISAASINLAVTETQFLTTRFGKAQLKGSRRSRPFGFSPLLLLRRIAFLQMAAEYSRRNRSMGPKWRGIPFAINANEAENGIVDSSLWANPDPIFLLSVYRFKFCAFGAVKFSWSPLWTESVLAAGLCCDRFRKYNPTAFSPLQTIMKMNLARDFHLTLREDPVSIWIDQARRDGPIFASSPAVVACNQPCGLTEIEFSGFSPRKMCALRTYGWPKAKSRTIMPPSRANPRYPNRISTNGSCEGQVSSTSATNGNCGPPQAACTGSLAPGYLRQEPGPLPPASSCTAAPPPPGVAPPSAPKPCRPKDKEPGAGKKKGKSKEGESPTFVYHARPAVVMDANIVCELGAAMILTDALEL